MSRYLPSLFYVLRSSRHPVTAEGRATELRSPRHSNSQNWMAPITPPKTNSSVPRLIINADDFGLTSGINRSIIRLHQSNALTSATLMATGPAFEDAVALASTHASLG